ncbi:MAG TPA: hypothetical protein VMV55_04480 [Methanoregula sp.]|nr:hypothetical protein [Methanoregula sp.]
MKGRSGIETRVIGTYFLQINFHHNRQKYPVDPTHYFPDKSSDRKATAIEILGNPVFFQIFLEPNT